MNFKQKPNKQKWWLPIVIAILLFAFFAKNNRILPGINNTLLPIKAKVYEVSDNVNKYFHSFYDVVETNRKNNELLLKIENQNILSLKNKELVEENQRLRAVLNLKERSKDKIIVAKITYIDALDPYDSIAINKGKKDGIEKNMAVSSTLGVVGRIIKVYDDHSTVELITSTKSYTSTSDESYSALGILNGQGNEILTLEYVITDDEVNIGDKIYTSGISDIYRKGLYLGDIISIKNKDEMFQEIEVKLSYNIFNLKYVTVLKKGE
ncbi:MAG: rod shape-determining protein MreC [Psychrilyobacter sp.]|nr:rod shape-determining protein MreC [Psychrilyobacter sp.]